MKQFDKVTDAMAHDGPALYVYDLGRRGSLFDSDRERLQIALVRCGLKLQYIHIRFDGKPEQCCDVSGDVLKKLLAECGVEEPTEINAPKSKDTTMTCKTEACAREFADRHLTPVPQGVTPEEWAEQNRVIDGDDSGGDDAESNN